MKRLIAILSALVLLGAAAFAKPAKSKGANAAADEAAPADNGKVSIAVPAPKAVNLGEGADWIPLFIQGIITANFQQYSGLTVIDRQNADMVKAEQRLSESAEFDEKNTLELGKLTNAHLTVTGNIMAKSGAYALTFNITDVETGETKASASVPNCPRSALEDGTAANRISYDLMTGFGIALSDDARKNLTQTASVMTSETSAQASVAKGIAAAKGGSNIEALTYYIRARASDSRLSEAASRMAGMTTVVAGGNFGASAKNMMKLHDDWEKLLLEAALLIAANPPMFEVRYFTDIEPLALTEKDYENETMSFQIGAPYLIQTSGAEYAKITRELMTAMRKIPESKNWGKKMNGFPWTYADDFPSGNWLEAANKNGIAMLPLTVNLLDANKNLMASRPYGLYVKFDKKYSGFEIYNTRGYGSSLYCSPYLTISGVPVGNADTDKIYISVEGAEKAGGSVLPSDALFVDKAISVLEAGSHNGTVKIGGFLPGDYNYMSGDSGYMKNVASAIRSNKKAVALDLSEMINANFGKEGFGWCTSLVSVIIPEGVTNIPPEAFKGCTSLTSVTIPGSVKKIGGYDLISYAPFYECNRLAEITISEGLVEIGSYAFYALPALKSITIPESVTEIGSYAFYECKNLESITIPESVTEIGRSAFNGCKKLESITIPESVTEIGRAAFIGCKKLESITIPEGVTKIDIRTFSDCRSLKSVTIPASVTEIGEEAFDGCKLKTVYYTGSKEQWDKIARSSGNYTLVSAKKEYNYKP